MMLPNNRTHRGPRRKRALAAALALTIGLAFAGCSDVTQVYRRGYILPEGALEQIPLGASQYACAHWRAAALYRGR